MTDEVYEDEAPADEEFVAGRDAFVEAQFGVPAISWVGAKLGTKFEYTLLDHDGEGSAYSFEPQRKMGTGEILYYQKDGKNTKNARMQYVITVQTDLTDHALTSQAHQDRAAENDLEDDGRRRVFIKGKANTEAFLKAVKEAAGKPELGGSGTITMFKRQANKEGNPTPLMQFTYTAPSPL